MHKLFIVFIGLFLLTACNTQHALTKEEMTVQNQADIAISNILFDAGMDTQASYNVRKSGHVEIEFVKTVSLFEYTKVVKEMRKNKAIKSVYAIQSGQELCTLH